MADVNLYLGEPKKVIGEYTEFFAGQLPTANDFNRWLAVLIAQGDYNTAWLDLIAETAGVSINELYEELSILSEIVTPGSGTVFSQRIDAIETNFAELSEDLEETQEGLSAFMTDVVGDANISAIGDGTLKGAILSAMTSITGTVLWTNPSPVSSFAGQTITLSQPLENFSKYEVIGVNGAVQVSTHKIDIGVSGWLSQVTDRNYARGVTPTIGTSIVIADANIFQFSGVSAVSNGNMIPIKVIGYK